MSQDEDKIMREYMQSEIAYMEMITEKDNRLLRVIESVLGKKFVEDVRDCLEQCEASTGIWLTKMPKGTFQEEDYGSFDGYWVNQYVNGGMTGDDFQGTISIKLRTGKYLTFSYAM